MAEDLSPRGHTRRVLQNMQLSGSIPANLDRDRDAVDDDYGKNLAGRSDVSEFGGKGSAPHMGRPGRKAGGRMTGDLIRTRRTPMETAEDIGNEDEKIESIARDRDTKIEPKNMTLQKKLTGSERDNFARGGRTSAKGKNTTVNVIIGAPKTPPPAAAGPPPPMPPPAPPPMPPHPPMAPPGGMPGGMPMGGAPMGAMGAPLQGLRP